MSPISKFMLMTLKDTTKRILQLNFMSYRANRGLWRLRAEASKELDKATAGLMHYCLEKLLEMR